VPGFAYTVCDVFTDQPLTGNQLAVFTDATGIPEELLQPLARELNYSETVYVLPPEQGGDARIRIFTPGRELPFAGHPVLGTAFVVGGRSGGDSVRLECPIGVIPIQLRREAGRVVFGRMEQPVPSWEPFPEAERLLTALGVKASELPVEIYSNGPKHVYVALGSEAEVVALKPDFGALAAVTDAGANCFAGSGRRWKTRMFAPAFGITEDPATGSGAGPLAVHLARHGRIGFGDEVEISQGAEIGRPSKLYAKAEGSAASIERVEVGGSAVIVAQGVFDV
jgi:trans-2,3-dihydro-3-hydroxyanthranilate isomerase